MKLIINADDFGLSKSITDGIIEGIKAGAITSTTLMANTEWTEYAIQQAIKNNLDCVGLHLNLTLGKPLTHCPSLCDDNGKFLYVDKQMANSKANEQEVYKEARSQLEFILNNGLKVSHIDSHHFSRKNPIIQKASVRLAKEYNLPMRREGDTDWKAIKTTDVFCDYFFGKTISEITLKKILGTYKDTDETVELMCHAGYMDDYSMGITSYKEREKELQTLLLAKKNGLFDDIELISFKYL